MESAPETPVPTDLSVFGILTRSLYRPLESPYPQLVLLWASHLCCSLLCVPLLQFHLPETLSKLFRIPSSISCPHLIVRNIYPLGGSAGRAGVEPGKMVTPCPQKPSVAQKS